VQYVRDVQGVNAFRMERKLRGSFCTESFHETGERKDGALRKLAVTKPGLNSYLVTVMYSFLTSKYVLSDHL